VDVFQKQCFAVFCGVLRCFVCVFLTFFSQNSTKQTKKYTIKRTKRTEYAMCNTAQYDAVQLSLTQKMSYKKHSQNTSKTLQNIRKTPQNTVFLKTLAKHHKTPAKHPQNTAKHHKTHLLTKQTELANK